MLRVRNSRRPSNLLRLIPAKGVQLNAGNRQIFNYRTLDIVTIVSLGVAFGVVFWGWAKLYDVISALALFTYPPAAGLLGGPWLIAGVVGGLIIRKPGAAVITELVAASVEPLIVGGTHWGMGTVVSGVLQGLGAEIVLAIFLYRRFGPYIAAAAGMLAGVFESLFEWQAYYADWHLAYRVVHLGFFMISGAIIAGLGAWLLTRALARAGVLDAFRSGPSVDV